MADLTETELAELVQSGSVEFIEEDGKIRVKDQVEPDPNDSKEAIQRTKTVQADGQGVKIAVLDTGISAKSGLSVVGGVSFIGQSTDYADDNGHGTYIASIIGGKEEAVEGIAPKASIYSLKVLDKNAEGSFSAVIEAIEWAVANKMDIAVMSFGTDVYSPSLAEAVSYAQKNGLLLVAAAGNEGSDRINYPARFHSVIAVGAVDGSLLKATFSNTGTELELMAEGIQVPGIDVNGNLIRRDGTSSSASIVTGIAALYMDHFPSLNNNEIRQLMNASAAPLGDSYEYGNGLAQFTVSSTKGKTNVLFEDEEETWIKETLKKQLEKEKKNSGTNNKNKANRQERPDAQQRELLERIDRKKKRELDAALAALNEEKAGLNIQNLVSEYNVAENVIQEQLDQGFTLEEVSRALGESKPPKRKTPVNHSKQAKSTIESDIPDEVDLTRENVFRASALPPQPEAPKLDMLHVKLDEAPYRLGLETENISTVSGSLSLSESDFTLPGRNGHSYTLTRTYDSGSSQLYDSDVRYESYDYYEYYAAISGRTDVYTTQYYLDYNYHAYKNKYVCSTGAYVLTASDYWTAVTSKTFSSSTERSEFLNNLPSYYEVENKNYCTSADRKYVTKYYLSTSQTSGTVFDGSYPWTDSLGPYKTYSEAQSVANQYSSGQYYGTNSSGNEIYYVTGTSVVSQYLGSTGYYVNQLIEDKDEKRFPIGKGWTWELPYMTFNNGTYVHLAGGGTYKVESGTLKGYPWKDLTLQTDTSVTVNGLQSAHVLKSITGRKQYFDGTGKIIQISDVYGNNTQFKYASVTPYGVVLTEITDAIGNKIAISYSTSQVTLTMGDRQVIYKKTLQNGKELLTQVVDPMQRVTTYDYAIKSAKFNLLGSSPSTENPYALITGVTHPTGSKTLYEYEAAPVVRYTSANSVNEVYRIDARKDVITYSDNTTSEANETSFIYPTDMGSSYNVDLNFTTKILKGELESVYTYKKDYIDDQTAPMIYNSKVEESDQVTKRITEHTYDEVKRIPNPILCFERGRIRKDNKLRVV